MKEINFELVTTKGGDRGESSLYSGERLRKDDIIFETLGDLDELNSYLGVVKSLLSAKIGKRITWIQKIIMNISAQVATDPKSDIYSSFREINDKDINRLERYEKVLASKTKIKPVFIVPGGITAHIDYARALTRRCERRIVQCIRDRHLIHLPDSQRFMNRLSDVLFFLGRFVEQHS